MRSKVPLATLVRKGRRARKDQLVIRELLVSLELLDFRVPRVHLDNLVQLVLLALMDKLDNLARQDLWEVQGQLVLLVQVEALDLQEQQVSQ
jgi:hypothetical protein